MTAEARSSSKDRPRALFINRFYYPDHSATSQILTDVTAGLTALGWPVTVISSRMGYEDPSARYPAKDAFNGVSIVRVATSRFGRSNLVGRAIDYVSFYVTSFFAVLSEARRGDVVIVKLRSHRVPGARQREVGVVAHRLRGVHGHLRVGWIPQG